MENVCLRGLLKESQSVEQSERSVDELRCMPHRAAEIGKLLFATAMILLTLMLSHNSQHACYSNRTGPIETAVCRSSIEI